MNIKNTKISEKSKLTIYDVFMQEINSISVLLDKYPFEKKQAYGYFLNQQYFLIRYSTRLLALSASQIETTETKEFSWWVSHLAEEINHDQLILKDMLAIGYLYDEYCEPVIRGLSLALFEDIRRNGQDALLGYALMLEGLSLERCNIIAKRINSAYGTGHSYLKLHATADEKHFPQGISRLETFSAERQKTILENLHMSAYLYRNFLHKINRTNY